VSPVARPKIHPSNLAGSWYSADAAELRLEIERCLGEEHARDETLRALLVPHAGYRYSGRVAGAAFAKVERSRWRRAVVLAPSHHRSFAGAAVFPGEGFETPLGIVRVEREGARRLAGASLFAADARPYGREHALEIELPFLQVVDPALSIVPVLVGSHEASDELATLGRGLAELDDGDTLYVVSSDFTHYGASFDYLPFPPFDPGFVSAELRRLDFGAIEAIRRGDRAAFADYLRSTGITVCGRGPIEAFLSFAGGRYTADLAAYQTSLDVTGDFEHSVSYAALLFHPAAEGVG
jgi:AmmeMemoRadiSam system protein B